MTDTEMLKRKIADGGFIVADLAKALGISENSLSRKICGEEEFFVSELWDISKILGLNEVELQEIFFANIVEYNATK